MTSKLEVISEYSLLHMWGVFSKVFWGGESEFVVRFKFRGQWRSLRSSNDLQNGGHFRIHLLHMWGVFS